LDFIFGCGIRVAKVTLYRFFCNYKVKIKNLTLGKGFDEPIVYKSVYWSFNLHIYLLKALYDDELHGKNSAFF